MIMTPFFNKILSCIGFTTEFFQKVWVPARCNSHKKLVESTHASRITQQIHRPT